MDEMNVKLCEGIEIQKEYLVNYAGIEKQVIIVDIGAPVSLVGKEWIERYLREHEIDLESLHMEKCEQMFRFGPSKKYVSKEMVELPMLVKMTDGNEDVLKIAAYIVDAEVPFLVGKKTLEDIDRYTKQSFKDRN